MKTKFFIFFRPCVFLCEDFQGNTTGAGGGRGELGWSFSCPNRAFTVGFLKNGLKIIWPRIFGLVKVLRISAGLFFHWKINDGAGAGGELGVLGACHERRAPEVGLPGCGQESKDQILALIFHGVELGKPPAFCAREKHPPSCELPGLGGRKLCPLSWESSRG